ncbi:MAG: hypothetical protein Q8K86_05845 [Candidatus Nanopelagicaceae bacterium]|nr:hypothetical protein [Candidatus Nanopelagicaceae bacterium]
MKQKPRRKKTKSVERAVGRILDERRRNQAALLHPQRIPKGI